MMTVSKTEFDRELLPDDCPDPSYLEQEGFEDRLSEYQHGEFGFIGIRAAVELKIPYGKGHILQKIESPGLWGIESDSGDDYLKSVFQEESEILADMLKELEVKVTP
jgi:hypothetical protein